jgi:hypothetical protein
MRKDKQSSFDLETSELAARRLECDEPHDEKNSADEWAHVAGKSPSVTQSEILAIAGFGTAIAGGCYAIALWSLGALFHHPAATSESWEEILGIAVSLLTVGMGIGFVYAGSVGFLVFTAIGACAAFCRLPGNRFQIAVFAGGVTGLACASPLPAAFAFDAESIAGLAPLFLAVVMGQVGAWLSAKSYLRAAKSSFRSAGDESQNLRLSLGQLFHITSIGCVVAAAMAAIQVTSEFYLILALGVVSQVVMTTASAVVDRVR